MITKEQTLEIEELQKCETDHNIYIKSWDNLLKKEYYAQVVCKNCRKKTKIYISDRSIDAVNLAIKNWNKSLT